MIKKSLSAFILLFSLLLFFSHVQAQVVVVKPAPPGAVVVKPAAPYPHAVWVEPEWRWDGPTHVYVYLPGHWVRPHGGFIWVPGHWMSLPGGFQWVPGHWRRVK